MKKGEIFATLILVLLFVFSTLIPSTGFSCQTPIKPIQGSLVCLLPDHAKGRYKPVMALVTDDGEFYPIVGSKDPTLSLNIDKGKLGYTYNKIKGGGK